MRGKQKFNLTVSSDHGSPTPSVGMTTCEEGTSISCKVKSPVTERTSVYACTGWSGSGSVAPASGKGTSVTFPIDADSTITWNWKSICWCYGTVGAQVVSVIAFAFIVIFAIWSYNSQLPLMTAAWAGAIGGLIHEIAQSQGTYVLPNTDDKGNLCLGGLFGIIGGGVAGLLAYKGLTVTTGIAVSQQLFIGALLAGLAFKGFADAVNPPSKQSS
jgi:hypothetical protein